MNSELQNRNNDNKKKNLIIRIEKNKNEIVVHRILGCIIVVVFVVKLVKIFTHFFNCSGIR